MRTDNQECRPLLRGTIIDLTRWWDHPDHPGWQRRSGIVAVWCPHCRRFHTHGWNLEDNAAIASHRVAHCDDGPFREAGYYITVWQQSDPESAAHVAKPGKPIVRRKP